MGDSFGQRMLRRVAGRDVGARCANDPENAAGERITREQIGGA